MSEEAARGVIVSANPFRCRMWGLHDRTEEDITEESCRQEIASFKRYGQFVPVLGRSLERDPAHDIELIFGARRLFVARHLNVPLRVELRKLSDREAIVSMDIENRQRQDLSPYERGVAYTRWLRDGHFNSQDDIASALGISAAQVSKLLKIARLPPVIVSAFARPADIREGWGLELAAALEDSQRRERTIRKAREIALGAARPPAADVCRQLLAAACSPGRAVARSRDEVVLDENGRPLFRVRHARKAVMLLLPAERITAATLRDVIRTVSSMFQTASAARSKSSKMTPDTATTRSELLRPLAGAGETDLMLPLLSTRPKRPTSLPVATPVRSAESGVE